MYWVNESFETKMILDIVVLIVTPFDAGCQYSLFKQVCRNALCLNQ